MINGRYALDNKLGQGGMGIVHRATDRLTGETVALKQVFMPVQHLLFASRPASQSNQELRLALAHEFQMLASMRHPNIISVLDYGFDENEQPFFTMSYLENAQTILVAGHGRSLSEKTDLILQTLEALAYLHRRGILHRDIKPDNVLVVGDTVRVLDFGLAAAKEQATESVGSWFYMAPELLQGEAATEASDLYSAGVLAYQLFAHDHPFDIHAADVIGEILEGEPDWGKLQVGEALTAVVAKLLAKNPHQRYQSAAEAIAAFSKATNQSSPHESLAIRESYLQAAQFVGREVELSQLLTALQAGQGSIWLIGGESGVGKSRLLDELRIRALVSGWRVFTGQAVADGGMPYQLWRQIAQQLMLDSTISDLEVGVLSQIAAATSSILKRHIPELPPLHGAAAHQRLVLTLSTVLQRQTQPTLLLLEDLQWAREGLAPLEQLAKVIQQTANVVIVGTYRQDEYPTLPTELAGIQLLLLERLDETHIASLCQAMLGKKATTPQLVSLLTQETEGNTFFIVEVMHTLAAETGKLRDIGTMSLPSSILTSGMQHLLRRRLEKVPQADRWLLQLTAVYGRQLDLNLLATLAPPGQLDPWLQRSAESAIFAVRDDQWLFTHDKLRETIIANLDNDTLQQRHRQVAEAIEQVYANDKDYFQKLLEHWHHAGNIDKEMHYLNPVAKSLIEITADYHHASKLLARGLQRLQPHDERRTQLLNWQAQLHTLQGNYPVARSFVNQAQEMAHKFNDQYGMAASLHTLGRIAYLQGDYEQSRSYHEQSLAIHQAIGDQPGIANDLNNLGNATYYLKQYDQARAYHEQSLAIRQAINDQAGIANSLNNLGIIAYLQDDLNIAQVYHHQSLIIRQQIGELYGIASSLNNLGMVAYKLSNFEQARDFYQESLLIRQDIGEQIGIAICSTNLGFAYHKLHDKRARSTLQQALLIARPIKAIPLILEILAGFAWFYLDDGKVAEAASLVSFVRQHPLYHAEVMMWLAGFDEQIAEKEAGLAKQQDGQKQAQALELDVVIQQLLKESLT